MNRKLSLVFLILLLLQLSLLLIFIFFRHIDADEGTYLMFAYQVAENKLPYFDFFYPQMPYLPYFYAPFSHLGFSSLFWGRAFSALLCLLTSLLLYYLMFRLTNNQKLALATFFLYVFNSLTLNWHSVIKTYALSDLFGLLSFAFLVFSLLNSNNRAGYTFLAGLFIGLAFNCRLTFLSIFCLELLATLLFFRRKLISSTSLVVGAIFSSVGSIYLLLKDADIFLFNNWWYHQLWGTGVIKMGFLGKLFVFLKFISYPQNLFILILALITCIYISKNREHSKTAPVLFKTQLVALGFCVIFILLAFLPNPSQFQYYQHTIPYLLIFSVPPLGQLLNWLERRRFFTFVGSLLYLLGLIPFMLVFVFAVRSQDKIFKINQVREVVEVIQENSTKGDHILSFWNGYIVLSQRKLLSGNYTWDHTVTPLLSKQQIKRFNLLDREDVNATISSCKPTLIIDINDQFYQFFPNLKEYYLVLKDSGEVKIYVQGERCKK